MPAKQRGKAGDKAPFRPESIEQLPVRDLIPYARNSKKHSQKQLDKLVESIKTYGFTVPVMVDATGEIIAGHGRVMAAKQMGMETVPCIRLGHLTPEQKRAYVIADNKIASMGEWDEEMLNLELAELGKLGVDLSITGFDTADASEALAKAADMFAPPEEAEGDAAVRGLKNEAVFPQEPPMGFPPLRRDMLLEIPDKLSLWVGQDISKDMPPPYVYMYASDSTRELDWTKTIVGFYVDDYRFERFWDNTDTSVQALLDKKIMGAIMPNYSTYFDWARAVNIYSMYRSRFVARYMQEAGIRVIPDAQCDLPNVELMCEGLKGIPTIAMQAHQRYSSDTKGRIQKLQIIDYVMETVRPDTVLLYAPADRLDMFPSLRRARIVRVEPRMSVKSAVKKARNSKET